MSNIDYINEIIRTVGGTPIIEIPSNGVDKGQEIPAEPIKKKPIVYNVTVEDLRPTIIENPTGKAVSKTRGGKKTK